MTCFLDFVLSDRIIKYFNTNEGNKMSEQIKNQTNINSVQGDAIFNQNTSVDAKNYYHQEVHMINKGTGAQINELHGDIVINAYPEPQQPNP